MTAFQIGAALGIIGAIGFSWIAISVSVGLLSLVRPKTLIFFAIFILMAGGMVIMETYNKRTGHPVRYFFLRLA